MILGRYTGVVGFGVTGLNWAAVRPILSDQSFTETTADALSILRSLFGYFLARSFFSFDCCVFVQEALGREHGSILYAWRLFTVHYSLPFQGISDRLVCRGTQRHASAVGLLLWTNQARILRVIDDFRWSGRWSGRWSFAEYFERILDLKIGRIELRLKVVLAEARCS